MYKKFLTFLMLSIYTMFCLTGCGKKADPIVLPETKEITSISIKQIDGTQVLLEESDGIQNVLSTISSASATSMESVQDVPLAEQFGTIEIKNSDNITKIFYYEKDKKYYIEQSYQGIYEIKDNFEHTLTDIQ